MNHFFIYIRHASQCLAMLLLLGLGAQPALAGALAPPNWSVDPDAFEFNMNAVLRVRYTGNPSNAAGNKVGAFVGNELRGVADPIIINGDAYFFLTVYSNQYFGETVRFKVYYAPNDEVYGSAETVEFVHNLYVGNLEDPFWVNIDPNADYPPVLDPILADTTLQNIPFEPVNLVDYLFSPDGDPVGWSAQAGPNLTAAIVNGVLTVTPVSAAWTGTDSVRIIVTEQTPGQLADTVTAWFTVLPDYGAPQWGNIPGETIFQGDQFTPFDLDDYLNFNGPCRAFDYVVYPFSGADPDPAWPVVAPGNQPMNIVARPLFADIALAGAGAKLAGFVNGTLAGWATPTGIPPAVTYQLTLANVGAGAITFRFYDAANQYLYEEPSTLNYAAGASVGSVASPYLIQLSPLVPALSADGQFSMTIDDPDWLGDYPIDFIVWDCDYPDIRRDTFQAIFSIVPDAQPEIISPETVNFEENACTVLYDAQTIDPNFAEGAGLTYSVDGGADASRFAIDPQTGILSWAAPFSPDFENPADADGNNQYVVVIKVTNTSSLFDLLTLTVSITNQAQEPFTAGIQGGNLFCTNGSANLQATGGVSYVWSNGSLQPAILVTAGTYTVTATSTGGCTATASAVVAPPPSISASGNSGTVCIGSPIQLNSTPAGGTTPYATFSWSGPDGYSASVEDPAAFPATAASGGVYTVSVTDAAGCTASGTTTINVSMNTAPTVTAGSDSPACVGETIALQATPAGGSGGYTYVWAGPNNYLAAGQNPQPFVAVAASGGTYSVTVTDNSGCSGTNTTQVVVYSNPVVTATSNSPVSVGATILLQASASGGSGGGYTYLWSGPDNFQSTAAQPAGFPATLAAEGVYKVTLTDGNGCTHTASTSVDVVPCPGITASVNGAVCEGGNIVLQSTPVGGALPYNAFAWAGPGGYSASVEDPPGFPATMAANGTYTVTVTDHLGCTATATVAVTVNPNPTIVAQNNGPMCSGSTALLSSTPSGGTPGYTFFWTGPDFFSATAEDPAPFTATNASAGVYQVKVTDNKGCTATATTTLSVYARPGVTVSSNSPLCLDANLNLQSNPTGGGGAYTFNWAGPAGFGSMLEDPTIVMVTAANSGTYTVTVTDNNSCTSTASTIASISSNHAPTITAFSNSPLCSGSNLTLSSTALNGTPPYTAYAWSGPNSYASNQEDPPPFQVFLNGAGVYQVTVTDTKNCKGTASVTVVVSGQPVQATSNSPVCPNANIVLSAGAPAGGGVTYVWSGPNGFSSFDRNPTPFPAVPAAAGTYHVTVTENGCSNTGSATVDISDNTPPTIACPANITLNADANCAGVVGSYAPTSLNDNCNPNPSVTQSPAAGTALNGHNDLETITLTANDGNGNTASCSFTVTLKDVTPPTIVCPANTTLNADVNCSGVLAAYSPTTLSDNCNANLQVTQTPAAGTVLNGHNDEETVTLATNDGNGNPASCSFTVTLKDVTPPTIVCPANTTLNADANCSGELAAYSPTTLSDNCNANLQVTQTPAAGTVLNGHNDEETVTLATNDGNGNPASCSFTVTLKDVTPPTIVCPANITLSADVNCSGVVGAYSPTTLSDNCNANLQVTQTPASGTVLNGHNDVETVTLSTNDGNGNPASCSFTVTLKDVTPPTIVCPANTTVAADNNCSGVVGARTPVTLTDNCNANPALTQTPPANTVLSGHNDVEMVTLTANDGNGNSAACSFIVTLKDVTPPTIVCPANTTVAADANCSGVVGARAPVTLSDNCNTNQGFTQAPPASTVLNGHNDVETVTLTANDGNGNTASCSFTVTLKDVTPPTIVCPANTTVAADANCSGVVGARSPVSVGDNCNANPPVTQTPPANTVLNGHDDVETVTLTADDGNGNTASCSFTVTLKDVTPPSITCHVRVDAPLNASGMASITPADMLQSGSDNCGILNLVSAVPNSFTCANLDPGSVIGTLTTNDGHGNVATCTSIISIVDSIEPTMLCRAATINLNASGMATLSPTDVNNGSFDNCAIVEYSLSQTVFSCAHIGANMVTLTGRDQSLNTATCVATVTVRDVDAPIAKCKNATINLGANGSVLLQPSAINNGTTDNCSFTLTAIPSLFNCSNLGNNTVVLRATDTGGNTSTCTALVTVKDVTPPTALCKNATIYLNNLGKATLAVAQIDNNSVDNCSISSRNLSRTQFDCVDIASAQAVILTVTDGSANSATCQAFVTVKDTIRPTAVCQNTTVQLGPNGTVSVYGSVLASGSFDNCAVWSYSPTVKVYTAANIGNNNLVITVKDFSNNPSTCTSVVTVLSNGPDHKPAHVGAEGLSVEYSDIALKLAPNPSSGELNLSFILPGEQRCEIRVLDVTGRMMARQAVDGFAGENTVPVYLDGLPDGLYFVDFQANGRRSVSRLILQR